MNIKVERIHPNAKLPHCAHPGEDLCFDLYAVERTRLYPFQPTIVATGLKMELPDGWGALIRPRSGMGSKGVAVLGGEIDNGYRGEVKVLLALVSKDEFIDIEPGDRIAQFRPQPIYSFEIEEANGPLSQSARGEGGLGSTGK